MMKIHNRNYCIKTLFGHNNSIRSIDITKNSKFLFSGSEDNTIMLWSFEKSKVIRTFLGHCSEISSITISQDIKYLFSGSWDYNIKIWSI